MKTTKLLISIMLLLVAGNVMATTKPGEGVYTRTHAVNTYVAAMVSGKLDGLGDVVDPSAKFTTLQGKKLVSSNKKEMMDFLEKIKNIEEDCTIGTSMVENNTEIAVVKVDMQFKTFTRSNYVTIANTGNGWKIINVYSIFN